MKSIAHNFVVVNNFYVKMFCLENLHNINCHYGTIKIFCKTDIQEILITINCVGCVIHTIIFHHIKIEWRNIEVVFMDTELFGVLFTM